VRPVQTNFLLAALLSAALPAFAGELEQQMIRCSVLGDASARLGCFDALTKAAAAATVAGNPTPDPTVAPPKPGAPVPEVPTVIPAIASAKSAPPEAPISRMQQDWELTKTARRGVFAVHPLRDNYLLLANVSSASNDTPYETTPGGLKSKHVEMTYQLSLKMKVLEQIAGSPVDLWVGYTQQSFWQAYNRAASSPFRETNYEPEAMLTLPLNVSVGDFNFRYVNLGAVHQSNGQRSTLSRSWNRLYTQLGMDYNNVQLTARLWKRLDTARADNDNPDITDFLGHGDLRLSYRNAGYEYSIMGRRNFSTRHGALQAGVAFPLVANLKGYVQLFSGYGQSLIDYNYSQKSIGGGFMVDF
jgi:phospholipase A1